MILGRCGKCISTLLSRVFFILNFKINILLERIRDVARFFLSILLRFSVPEILEPHVTDMDKINYSTQQVCPSALQIRLQDRGTVCRACSAVVFLMRLVFSLDYLCSGRDPAGVIHHSICHDELAYIADIFKIEKTTDYVMHHVSITSSQFLLRYGNFKQIADSESCGKCISASKISSLDVSNCPRLSP